VRIIAATNTPVETLRDGGDFREDLFYRLHVVPITLPPVRDRPDDISPLVTHFIEKLRSRTQARARTMSPEALNLFEAYHWPGNVRELENVVERALVLAEGEQVEAEDLPPMDLSQKIRTASDEEFSGLLAGGMDLNEAVETIEERLLRGALEQANGVKAEAARLLGLKPSALYYKLEKYGIEL